MDVDGRELWLSMTAVPFPDGTVFTFRDLTEEHALERLKNDFVSTVSHELRTPLAAIYGAAMTLQRTDVALGDDQRSGLLDVVAGESERLARIVNDVLWASRLDSGILEVSIESCDAGALVTTVASVARAHLPPAIELDRRRASADAVRRGRPRQGAAGAGQPDRQRDQVLAGRRPRRGARRARRALGALHGVRPRARHPRGRAQAASSRSSSASTRT